MKSEKFGESTQGSIRGLPEQEIRQNKRRDTYLTTLLSSRISERTNMLSRMQAASPVGGEKKSSLKETEPPSAKLGTVKIPRADKNAELSDSANNDQTDADGRI